MSTSSTSRPSTLGNIQSRTTGSGWRRAYSSSAVELQPDAGDNYFWRGRAHFDLADCAAALADFSRACELQPDAGNNYFWRGLAHVALKDYAAALDDLDAAQQREAMELHTLFWRGVAQVDWDAAAALAPAEADVCSRRRAQAKLSLVAGDAAARAHYAAILEERLCPLPDLRTELLYLSLLASLPGFAAATELGDWLAARLEHRENT